MKATAKFAKSYKKHCEEDEIDDKQPMLVAKPMRLPPRISYKLKLEKLIQDAEVEGVKIGLNSSTSALIIQEEDKTVSIPLVDISYSVNKNLEESKDDSN